MAEQIQGGLAAASQAQPPSAPPPAAITADSKAATLQGQKPEMAFDQAVDELRKGRSTLDLQIERLKESLDKRTRLPFDPMWMKVASGFLKPTKTGSFGESLGNAAEGAAEEAPKEQERQAAIEKMKLELSEKSLGLKQSGVAMEDLMRLSGAGQRSQPSGTMAPVAPTPALGQPSAGATSGAAQPMPAGDSAATGTAGPFRTMPMISDSDVTRAYAISKEHGDKIAAIAKMQREDIISTPQGPFSRSTQTYLKAEPFQNQPSDFDLAVIGTKKLTQKQYREYEAVRDEIKRTGDETLLPKFYESQGWIRKKPGAEGRYENFETPEDAALRKKERETEAEEYAKGNAKQASALQARGEQAFEIKNTAKTMTSLATSNERAFDLLQSPTVLNSFLRAIAQGVQTPGGSINFDTREIAQGWSELATADREALQLFAQQNAQFNIAFRKVFAGQGAVSDRENALAAALGPLPSDSARVIRLKSELLGLRADFDENAYKTWTDYHESTGKSYSKFLISDEYKKAKSEYNDILGKVRDANAELLRTSPKAGAKDKVSPKERAVPNASPAPTAPPVNETFSQRLERLKREREGKK